MEKNVGKADKIIRIIAGIIMIVVGFFVMEGTVGTLIGIAGFVPLLTGLTGRCLLYYPFRINTN